MGLKIIPQIIRGRLFYQVSDVLFPSFRAAVAAWSAAEAHRLDLFQGGAL